MNEHALKLLYEAFRLELLCRFIRGSEWLVDRNTYQPRNEKDQEYFGFLLGEGLIEESDQISEDFELDCFSCYRITTLGIKAIGDNNLDRDELIGISHFELSESRHNARWDTPWSVWEQFKGSAFGDLVDTYGEKINWDSEIEIAKVEFFRLNIQHYSNCGFDINDNPMSVNDALLGYGNLLRDNNGRDIPIYALSEYLSEQYEPPKNLLLLNHIQLNPKYLGMGLGAHVIRRLFARYAPDGGIGVIIPFPLQFANSYDRSKDVPSDFIGADRSLRTYYERIGFVSHPYDESLMICSLSNSKLSSLPIRLP